MSECDSECILTDSRDSAASPAGMFFRLMSLKLEGEGDSDSQNDNASEWTKGLRPLPVTSEINTSDLIHTSLAVLFQVTSLLLQERTLGGSAAKSRP